MGEGGRAGNG